MKKYVVSLFLAFMAFIQASAQTVEDNPFASKGKIVCGPVHTTAVGDVYIISANPGQWKFEMNVEATGEKEILHIGLKSEKKCNYPDMKVYFATPQNGVTNVWSSVLVNSTHMDPFWEYVNHHSSLASQTPLYAYFDNNNQNHLTIACSETFRNVGAKLGLLEEGCSICTEIHYFTSPEAPADSYETQILLDARPVFWSEPLQEASEWMMTVGNMQPCDVPSDAFAPLYSSWYQFHQKITDKAVEEECKLASALGMKTIILDDGWQTDNSARGYAFCGDWQPTPTKFPDMAQHVSKVHEMGMKYMIWYSVPYVGFHSEAFKRFKGKFLQMQNAHQTAILDPRFPDVREYLIQIYVKALKDWNLDGFKLDFIDSFSFGGKDPALNDNYAGRDYKSVNEAVNTLMKDVATELHKIKPNILLEFRQSYIGPAIRQYGNMFRAADCPGNMDDNRYRIAQLRLTSGGSAVHSDMLEWHKEATNEHVARTLLSCIFGVIQYSMMLSTLPENHLEIIKNVIRYANLHRTTLLQSRFRPYHPEAGCPVIEAESDLERIIGIYQDNCVINTGELNKPIHLLNGSTSNEICIKMPAGKVTASIYDVFGKPMSKVVLKSKGNLSPIMLSIPVGGHAELK